MRSFSENSKGISMKLLVLGDLHGNFPKSLKKFVKKQKPDSVIYLGDFSNDDAERKIIFKHWNRILETGMKWWDIVGVEKAERMLKESFKSGITVMKQLNSLQIPVYFIFGNDDSYKYGNKSLKHKKGVPSFQRYSKNDIRKLKNFILIHKKFIKLNGFRIAGYGGYAEPTLWFTKNILSENLEKRKKRLGYYKKLEKSVNSVFKNFSGKNLIFVTHWPPYNFKFDKIINKESKMNGRHIGFEPFSRIDRKYKPLLHLCGHMHEHQGKTKIGKTTVVNPGYGREGKAAIIELNDGKPKVERIKFVRIK